MDNQAHEASAAFHSYTLDFKAGIKMEELWWGWGIMGLKGSCVQE